jgi:AcrR family transcriptional regulator
MEGIQVKRIDPALISRRKVFSAKPPRKSRAQKGNSARQRLDPAHREAIIAREAVSFFAERGFEGETRELAKRLGITQPLLYRYFASKEALIERVYQDVFLGRWNPFWEEIITDRTIPLKTRVVRFYRDYAKAILTYEWVRLFLFAGLRNLGLNARYLKVLRERIFNRVIEELRVTYGRPPTEDVPISTIEIEMIWGLHAAIFYLGVRQFVYDMPLGADVEEIVEAQVATFLNGISAVLPLPSEPGSKKPGSRLAQGGSS